MHSSPRIPILIEQKKLFLGSLTHGTQTPCTYEQNALLQ